MILFAFWGLDKTFYQQDEWLGLGQIWEQGLKHIYYGFSPMQLLFADGRPLTRLFGVLLFGPFAFNSLFLTIYGITFHFLNSILVFKITQKLLKNNFLSFISASFFAINSVSSQSVTWFGASFGTQPASLLIFLSIFVFIKFLERNQSKYLFLAFFLSLLSLYFKESSIFLFIFFPLVHFFIKKKFELGNYKKFYILFVIFITLFASFRLVEMIVIKSTSYDILTTPVFANIGDEDLPGRLLTRLVMYPLTSFSLVYIPQSTSIDIAFSFMKLYYPYIVDKPDLIATTVVLDLLAITLTFILIFLLYVVWKKHKDFRYATLFSVTWLILAIVPYVVVAKGFAYMEPRYYYVSLGAAGVILSVLIGSILRLHNKKGISIAAVILIIIYIMHIKIIRNEIIYQKEIASERLSFISQLYRIKPSLVSDKNIFYVGGDKDRFTEGNKSPLQNGPGYSLMVLYYKSGKVPPGLLTQGYLWGLTDQGYKETTGRGFGYYHDLEQLKEDIGNEGIDPENVIGLYYSSKTKKLKDITMEVKRELELNL